MSRVSPSGSRLIARSLSTIRLASTRPIRSAAVQQLRYASSRLHAVASPLGTGAAGIGELYRQISHSSSMDALWEGYRGGARIVDTAPFYGFGQSERRVGDFVREVIREHGEEQAPVVSTKVGRLLTPVRKSDHDPGQWAGGLQFNGHFDFTGPALTRSFEDSLQRLGLSREHVCSLVLHDLDPWHQTPESTEKHFAELTEGGGAAALGRMRGGKGEGVEAVGAGQNELDPARTARFLDLKEEDGSPLLDFFLVAGRMSLMENAAPIDASLQGGEEARTRWEGRRGFLQLLDERETDSHSVGVLVGGAYNSGLLAAPAEVLVAAAVGAQQGAGGGGGGGDPPAGADPSVADAWKSLLEKGRAREQGEDGTFQLKLDYADAPQYALQRAAELAAVCEARGVSLKAAALAFPLRHSRVASVIPGADSAAMAQENSAVFKEGQEIPESFWEELEGMGLASWTYSD